MKMKHMNHGIFQIQVNLREFKNWEKAFTRRINAIFDACRSKRIVKKNPAIDLIPVCYFKRLSVGENCQKKFNELLIAS